MNTLYDDKEKTLRVEESSSERYEPVDDELVKKISRRLLEQHREAYRAWANA